MINIEAPAVLENRLKICKCFKEKEWWFSYLYDPKQQLYFGYFFIRTYPTDHINFTCFDLKNDKTWNFEKHIMLDKPINRETLDLEHHKKNLNINFTRTSPTERNFNFSNKDTNISLTIDDSGVKPFTKFDDFYENYYSLYHLFGSRTKGKLTFGKDTYEVDTTTTYFDHCYGKVPSKSAWHWLAVNNNKYSLSSLVNYGVNPQCYTEVFNGKEWTRLSQEVSFEHNSKNPFDPWHITSPDLDLTVTPIKHELKITKIPPLIPFLLNISHAEFMVKVSGNIKIENEWKKVDEMVGVMEEHHGRW